MTNFERFNTKIRTYYNDYLNRNCDTNRKKLYAIRQEIKDLQYAVDSNKDELKNRLKEGFGWCWYLGERYSQFDLQKDIRTIEILKELYTELKK